MRTTNRVQLALVCSDPMLKEEFYLFDCFELIHKHLAVTVEKLHFRKYLVGPFYSTLYSSLSSGSDIIEVPLIPDPNGSELQRRWKHVRDWFEDSCLIDEACSLLLTVSTFDGLRDKYEPIWVAEESQHIPGFAAFYHKLKEDVEHRFGKLAGSSGAAKMEKQVTIDMMRQEFPGFDDSYFEFLELKEDIKHWSGKLAEIMAYVKEILIVRKTFYQPGDMPMNDTEFINDPPADSTIETVQRMVA